MYDHDPLNSLADAIGAALHNDLPLQSREQIIDWKTKQTATKWYRPSRHDIEVYMFPQMWGSTALGYGGIGGAAMTTAYTVIVVYKDFFAVYFGTGGRLAYMIQRKNFKGLGADNFKEDMTNRSMVSISEHTKRYLNQEFKNDFS
jgi:hypothetical protein